MKPTNANIVEDATVLGDCWMRQTVVCKYLGISRETLVRWNAKGQCLPHHVDKVTGRAMWQKRRLDAELLHGGLADFSGKSSLPKHKAREIRREKSHVR